MISTSVRRARRATTTVASAAGLALLFSGVALADTINDSIEGIGSVALTAGSGVAGSAGIKLVGTGGDGDANCNIDDGEAPLVLDILTPEGVSANPDPLSITSCGPYFQVTFTASRTAVSGVARVAVLSGPAGGGAYQNNVEIPITVTQPSAPANAAPAVDVVGVQTGAYEIGAVPVATCSVTDAEDGPSTFAAAVSGALSHGLGNQTATCSYTDAGGLTAISAVSYSIVDTGDPTISHTLSPAAGNAAGWYNQDVTVDFTCADGGSGIASCVGDTVLGEGANQSVTGTATDWAGNTATSTTPVINIDKTDPTARLLGGPTAPIYFGATVTAPTCDASDDLSGVASCVVTGGGTAVGTHTYAATVTDRAGNVDTATLTYEVLPWTRTGFYNPVDMGATIWNTVRGGSTVPLKFEVFAGPAGVNELTSTGAVRSFSQTKVTCPGSPTLDEIELVTTGGTSLRYDTSAGHFVQNWQTPKSTGCYRVTVTTQDGTSTTANFILR